MGEYHKIVTSQRWEPTDIKENYQDEHFPLDFTTGEIEEPVTKTENKADLKIPHSGKENDSGGYQYANSVATCTKCGGKGHIKRDFKYNINGSDGDSYERSTINIKNGSPRSLLFKMWNI